MGNELVIQVIRYMEWERVKGGLEAILASYLPEERELFNTAESLIGDFVREFGARAGLD